MQLGIYQIKPRFQQSLGGCVEWLVARRVHPDWLTVAALVLSVGGGLCLYLAPQQRGLLLLIPLVAIGRTALNALDGLVAHRAGLARAWGEVLNEFCDRLADIALFGGLTLAQQETRLLGAVTIVVMLLASYLAILSKAAGGRRQYGGPMGKADRMLLLAVVAPVGLVAPLDLVYGGFLMLVLLGLLLTIGNRVLATYRELEHPPRP